MTSELNNTTNQAQRDFGKDPAGFHVLSGGLEPISPDLGIDQTPVEDFFVCNAGDAPVIDRSRWSLAIRTSDRVLGEFDLEALGNLRQRDVHAWLECAGNGRQMFELIDGHVPSSHISDTQWMLSAMGVASWRGPSLRDVLELAGVGAEASWVGPTGLDTTNDEGEPIRMCLPADKAADVDTIIALEMNGAPLTVAHGYPARLIVPGWVGAYSVKWLGSIEVSDTWLSSWRADEYYQRRTADGTALGPATLHPVKSSLALDWQASLSPGPQQILGYARSGAAPIDQVEWSVDGGAWQKAQLHAGPGGGQGPGERGHGRWGWTPFSFEWSAKPGDHHLATRARDGTGAVQPTSMNYHPNTILWNAVISHPVRVEASQTT